MSYYETLATIFGYISLFMNAANCNNPAFRPKQTSLRFRVPTSSNIMRYNPQWSLKRMQISSSPQVGLTGGAKHHQNLREHE